MAVEVATGYVSIVPSMAGFTQKLSAEVSQAAGVAGDQAGKSFKSGIAAHAKSIAAGFVAGFAATKGLDFLRGAIDQASNLNESLNAVRVTYGKQAGAVTELGTKAAQALGLSKTEFNELSVRFSNFAKTVAGPGGDVVGTLDDLTTRASDFASVMNLDVANAAELFQSGLAGETEPLRKYGIDLSAAKVEAYALSHGIAENAGSMTEAQKVQARYALLMEQTSKTQGDFANTSDQLANKQRITSAQWKNAQAAIGNALLPVMQKLVGFIQDKVVPAFQRFGEWFAGDGSRMFGQLGGFLRDNSRLLLTLAGAVTAGVLAWKAYQGVMAVVDFVRTAIQIGAQTVAWVANTGAVVANRIATMAANGAMLVVRGAVAAWTVAQWALNAALSMNPIGIVVMAIAGLVAAIVLLWNKSETFRSIVIGVWEAIKTAAETVWNAIKRVIEVVWNAIEWYVRTYINVVRTIIETAWNWIRSATETVWNAIKAVISTVWDGIVWYVRTCIDTVKTVLSTAWNIIQTGAQTAWNLIKSSILTPISTVWTRIGEIVDNVKTGLADAWAVIQSTASTAWGNIKSAITGPLAGLWEKFKEILGVGDDYDGLIDRLAGVWDTISSKASSAWDGIVSAIKTPIQGLVDWIEDMFGKISGFIKSVKDLFGGGGGGGYGGMNPGSLIPEVVTPSNGGTGAGMTAWTSGSGNIGAAFRAYNPGIWSWDGGYHNGQDIGAAAGTPVVSQRLGVVTEAGWGGWAGNTVIMRMPNGVSLQFAHLSSIGARVGQMLRPGSLIGRVGSTGNSSGPHLHISAYRGGATINPVPFLAQGGIVAPRRGGTLAVLGEAGRHEAVIPLPPRLSNAAAMAGLGELLSGGRAAGVTNHWHVQADQVPTEEATLAVWRRWEALQGV